MEISEVIGVSERYQAVVIIVAFLQNTVTGCVICFVQLLAPDVFVHWNTNGTSTTAAPVFFSANCKLQEVINSKPIPNTTQPEPELIYEYMYARRTLTEKLNLICERSSLVSFSNSAIFFGTLVGSICFAISSERYGRRVFSWYTVIPCLTGNLLILFNQDYVMYLIGCFVYGLTLPMFTQASYISMVELFPKSARSAFSNFLSFAISLGQLVTVGLAWLIQDWFYTQMALTCYVASSFLLAWYIQESPSWLVVRDKYDEAENVLKLIIQRNRAKLEDVEPKIKQWMEITKKQSSSLAGAYRELLKYPVMVKYTLAISFLVFSSQFILLTLSMNMQHFGSNAFQDLAISAVLSWISCGFLICFHKMISVRKLSASFFLVLTMLSILYLFLKVNPTARTVIVCLTRSFISPILSGTFAYSAEVFPTTMRGLGFGILRTVGGLAGILSTFNKELGAMTNELAPMVLFASFSLLSVVLLVFVLPDPKGKALLQTVQEYATQRQQKDEIAESENASP